jgi:hypothetical protein
MGESAAVPGERARSEPGSEVEMKRPRKPEIWNTIERCVAVGLATFPGVRSMAIAGTGDGDLVIRLSLDPAEAAKVSRWFVRNMQYLREATARDAAPKARVKRKGAGRARR